MTAIKDTLSDKDMGGRKLTGLPTTVTGPTDAVPKVQHDTDIVGAKARANHTGTQTASTISDFDIQVRVTRPEQLATAQAPLTVVDGGAANTAASRGYVDTALAALTSGQTLKGRVRAAVAANVTIASPGATLDGLAAQLDDIFILTGQTVATENGPQQYKGSAVPMVRPPNWDTPAEAVVGSYWVVMSGTQADRFALMANDVFTLGTDSATFAFVGAAASGQGYSITCPAVAAGGTWTITHNLATRKLLAQLWRNGSPWDLVPVYMDKPTINTLTVQPDAAMAAAEWEIEIWKVA
ncbi:MAG: hypothetical protein H7Y15_09545 [Pseudonocardia sp.]|nr:hypothetical protein [Pseudonocardia sp.]